MLMNMTPCDAGFRIDFKLRPARLLTSNRTMAGHFLAMKRHTGH
jgi:hypothetical protein